MSRTGARRSATPAQPARSSGPAASDSSGPDAASGSSGADAVEPAAALPAGAEPAGFEPSGRGWEPLVKFGGVLVSLVFGFVSAVVELLLTTLRAGDFTSVWRGDPIGSGGGPLIPLSVVLAVAGNLGVAWFAVATVGRRRAIAVPWALWTVVMLVAAGVRTHEGDYLLSGTNYVALAMILIGSLTFAVYTYRLILQRTPPRN
jgi:hypothetical protein